jgi:hypothetical protein
LARSILTNVVDEVAVERLENAAHGTIKAPVVLEKIEPPLGELARVDLLVMARAGARMGR